MFTNTGEMLNVAAKLADVGVDVTTFTAPAQVVHHKIVERIQYLKTRENLNRGPKNIDNNGIIYINRIRALALKPF